MNTNTPITAQPKPSKLRASAQVCENIKDLTGKVIVFTKREIHAEASVTDLIPKGQSPWQIIQDACVKVIEATPDLGGQVLVKVTVSETELSSTMYTATVEVATIVPQDQSFVYVPEAEMDEIVEAARQLSAIHGFSQAVAVKKLVDIGVSLGKLPLGSKVRGTGDPRDCRAANCENQTRHKKGFCSPLCFKASNEH